MKPLLLLDIDGVLCPFDSDRTDVEPVPSRHDLGAVYVPEHGRLLRDLAKDFDLAWASMWEADANVSLAPLYELEPIPFVNFTGDFSHENFWAGKTFKIDAVEKFIEDRPMVWVDDDFFEDAFEWAAKRDETIPTMLIRTDCKVGLTDEDVDKLRSWKEAL